MEGILLIVLLIVIIVGYKQVTKYFKWIESTTGYKPLNTVNKVLVGACFVLPSIHNIAVNGQKFTIVDAILFLIPIGILAYLNIKIKQPLHIVLVTVLQVIFGLAFIFVAIFILVIGILFGISFGDSGKYINRKSRDIDFTAMSIKESWVGHETDYDRAQKLGYSNPEEAIKAGYMYDGTQMIKP